MNFNFKKLPPFKWFVLQNFPFIEADFDAITYYQLLCKIAEYLNKVIDDNNLIGEQTEKLTNAYNELQEYVNHYFDNLDIQEEINNKLDEMAQDGTLAEIINKQIFQELNTAIQNNSNNINKIENEMKTYPYFDIQKNGGFTDGSTPNDTIFSTAKTNGYKKFYFSQNSTNNAVYYFTNFPTFNDCEIVSDIGVKISLPSIFGGYTYLKSGKYKTNIDFIYRNQDNKNITTPSNISDLFNMLHINYDYRMSNMIARPFSYNSIKMFHYKYGSDFLFEEVTKTDYYEENNLLLSRKSSSTNGYFNGLCVPIEDNRNVVETCTTGMESKPSFVVLNSTNNKGIYCTYNGSTILVYYDSSSNTKLKRFNMFAHNLSSSNDWGKPMQHKMFYNKFKNSIQFMINNSVVANYELPFTPDYFGFGISENNSDFKMMRFCSYYQENLPLNCDLSILIVGDSRFSGEGQTYKIEDIIKNGLLYNGINNVTIDNQAVGGRTLSQIYNDLQNASLSNYDIVIVEGGINNYNTSQPSIAYLLNDIEVLLNDAGTINIYTTCMPCSFNGTDLHAKDRAVKYYGIVNSMYVGLGSSYSNNSVIIDNNMGNQTDLSNQAVCTDGVHPNVLGLIEISRNIINSIFNFFKIN